MRERQGRTEGGCGDKVIRSVCERIWGQASIITYLRDIASCGEKIWQMGSKLNYTLYRLDSIFIDQKNEPLPSEMADIT